MNILRQIGLNIRRLRLNRDLSQEALAFEADIALNYLSEIERGRRNPTILVVDRLAKALGVPLALLVVATPEKDTLPKNLRPGRRPRQVVRKTRRSSGQGKRD